MENSIEQKIKDFWEFRKHYPDFPYIEERRMCDIQYLVPKIKDCESLLDVGCGTGKLMQALEPLTHIKRFYGYDISGGFIEIAKEYCHFAEFKRCDILKEEYMLRTDVSICFGVLQYIIEDKKLRSFLAGVMSPKLYVRIPCMLDKRLVIDKYSDALRSDYASVYRTAEEYGDILSCFFNVVSSIRAFPDAIESKFSHRQHYFECGRK